MRLPLLFRLRLAMIRPSEQDERLAAQVDPDGYWNRRWWSENSSCDEQGTSWPDIPKIMTASSVQSLARMGASQKTVQASYRQMCLDQARWPKLFAALSRRR